MAHYQSPRRTPKRKAFTEEEATAIAFWIEELIDEDLEFPEDILASLRSGIDLCRLVDVLQPGIVGSVNTDDGVFAHAENLKAYLDACYHLGVGTYDLFDPQDLLENGDVQRVLRNIVALERVCVDYGYDGTRINIVDTCDRRKCTDKIEELLGEVGSIKRQLHDKDEDNTELRLENHDFKDKISKQEEEIFQLKNRIQQLEQSNQESVERYNLAMIDVQIIKLDHERLQQQYQDLYSTSSRPTPINERLLTKSEGGDLLRMKHLSKNGSSPDLKKLEEMKKFIKKEKKELMKQEKERKKKEGKNKNKDKDESKLEGAPSHDAQKLNKGLRSLTWTKLSKPKENRLSHQYDRNLNPSKSAENITDASATLSLPYKPQATQSPGARDRSFTAAGRLMSFVKPNFKHEGNPATIVDSNNTTTVEVYDVPYAP